MQIRALSCSSLSLGALALLTALACKQAVNQQEPAERPPSDGVEAKPAARYGAPLTGAPRASLQQVLAQPEQYADSKISVEGYVHRVCSKKGCWMELASDVAPEAPACRVTFKDYGFFVPTDSAGAHAVLEGSVQSTRVSPRRVAHHEREGAVFPNKQADGSAREVRLVATGVELRR